MVPVPPRRPAGPRARIGAGLSLLALLGTSVAALAQGAPAAVPAAGPPPGPVPPRAIPAAVPPSPDTGSAGKGPETKVPEAKGPETKPAESKPVETASPESKPLQGKPQETARKSREPAPLVYAKVSADPNPTLTARTFLDTLRAAERYAAFAEAGGWERLPEDLARLKPGERNPAIPALRHHLTLTGDLPADAPPSDRLDPPLVAAIAAFQGRHGLPDSGILGRLTINALNVPASVRQRQLAASASRLMGSKFPFGERYVVVNIPSAAVEAVENGTVVRRYVAVVGSPDKATPAVETRITDINFNPTWTVPASVVKNEIIP
ncbi:MAG: L,D-transpeptidase family protein, partial [Actinomycetospora chiangmaiensis]|nr:L,D-transpeptidase family protein [Actinomycetospora chiangmaiensis]